MTAPRVTIGMPVWNNARTVARAIRSVRDQAFEDWRLIVTDDGSDDETLGEARTAAAGDPRIEIRQNPARLGFENFAVALREATTPYFVWLAGDDYWAPEFLACLVPVLDAAPVATSALPEAAYVGPDERPIPNLGFLRGDAAERVRRYLAHPGGTRMYGLMRTDAVQVAFPRKVVTAYDWYLMVALLAQGPQMSVPGRLLFREETGWVAYAQAEGAGGGIFARYPVLQTSLMLLRDRKLPLRALPALAALNFCKHEEFLAVNRPETYLRRAEVFRRLQTPIARNPEKLAQLASVHRASGRDATMVGGFRAAGQRAGGRSTPPAEPGVTAIVTCRNAAGTLEAWLDHAEALGCRVIVIDHGSTDETRGIAEARKGGLVTEIIDQPFDGAFDLTAQLEVKQDVIARITTDWVWHADADEFLELEEGETLLTLTAAAAAAGQAAFACDETLHVPGFEDEIHTPAQFRRTLGATQRMEESDEKQRVFRRALPLDVWFETGGHTVLRDPARLAARRLKLAHYIGLSLDDLRGQYMSRVFAPRDTFKLWHGNRAVAEQFDVVAPGLNGREAAARRLPVFAPRDLPPEPIPALTDLVVLTSRAEDADRLRDRLRAVLPGLRAHVSTALVVDAGAVPVLVAVSHPGNIHDEGLTRSEERARACDWTRQLACARQTALRRLTPYAEVRIEDVEGGASDLVARIGDLLSGKVLSGTSGFLTPAADGIRAASFVSPVRDITRGLAADLGYQ